MQHTENSKSWINRTLKEALMPGHPLNKRLMEGEPNFIKTLSNLVPKTTIDQPEQYKAMLADRMAYTIIKRAWEKFDFTMHHMATNKMDWEKFWYDMVYCELCFDM